ncbi:MAG: tetratricopeptide repeat protein [Flavobacteriales bacterium]
MASLIVGSNIAYSQSEKEEELRDKAQDLFEDRKFIKAMPLYSQLLSIDPKNRVYNYKYGACVLAGKSDKEKALKYLELALKKKDIDEKAYYFMARAYHLNYKFDKAIKYYKKFKEEGGWRDRREFPVDHKIQMCKNGKDLLKHPTEIAVLKKVKAKRENFFRFYDDTKIGGRIIVADEEGYKTKDDEKKRHTPLIHFPPLGGDQERVFFASYGDDDEDKDIYMKKRKEGGGYGKKQKLGDKINTKFDEDYPYLHPNKKALYFCSKGHNSMGGYDVFKASFNPETETYGKVENMDFAINTPSNDLFYIVDKNNDLAYFASDRTSDAKHYNVYHVKVDRIPMKLSMIKGKFVNKIEPPNKKAEITVERPKSEKVVGIYNTDSESGDYSI